MYLLDTAGEVCPQPTASTSIPRKRDVLHVASYPHTPRESRLLVVAAVAEQYGCTVGDIMGKARRYAPARWAAWRAVQQEFGDGYAALGRFFKRDHTSIMYGLAKVRA